MHKAKSFLFAMFIALVGVTFSANAESPTASGIFSTIGGSTTIDKGGAIESQARSIYSLGGGMSSFHGKKVSLIAADPPSFSAGCSGISWHFGGFAFISVDEIRQLVEAVAQASLGVAVDLAMQTLCPQCYAVMAKLREIANMMRNAAADSCKIAKNFGSILQAQMPGLFQPSAAVEECGVDSSANNSSDSSMGAQLSNGLCSSLSKAESFLNTAGTDVMNFLNGQPTSDGKTPSKEELEKYGNTTYAALTALGYKDGFVKDVLLSYLGMRIIFPNADSTCASAFQNFSGTPSGDQPQSMIFENNSWSPAPGTSTSANGNHDIEVTGSSSSDAPRVTASTVNEPDAEPSGATKAVGTACDAPPVLTSTQELATLIVCGADVNKDKERLKQRFPNARIEDSSLDAMCGNATTQASSSSSTGWQALDWTGEAKNTMIYHCGQDSADCMEPQMMKLEDALNQDTSNDTSPYTGLAWMVMDALYSGVQAVIDNKPMPDNTVAMLNGAGYPLYRLINMAAVYPGMTDELLSAYGASISVQFAIQSISKITLPGANPAISYLPSNGVSQEKLLQFRADIMNITRQNDKMADDVLKRLSEKRALVDAIVQVNKALQAEVISQGLGGNADLAVSLKKQLNTK
ncbi:uncharacterized protein NMK_2018 [Novimethylophilus kurashikiensis]|uniref:Conjugal transfer protein TraH n=1 Tax=Novimethylophilus kurashikiensis TaxID=1825523 RepID=A0A2R5F9C1_9PROT|nr:conjugal transfer protein TraH [Novimethylophilus kurashikiensis]GBG14419.1 uncharacterized protein NMK_2018 [Novimethylophilus kurashikiensis]